MTQIQDFTNRPVARHASRRACVPHPRYRPPRLPEIVRTSNDTVVAFHEREAVGRPGPRRRRRPPVSSPFPALTKALLMPEIWVFALHFSCPATSVRNGSGSGTFSNASSKKSCTNDAAWLFSGPKRRPGGIALPTRIHLGDDRRTPCLPDLGVAVAAISVRSVRGQKTGRFVRFPLRLRPEEATGS